MNNNILNNIIVTVSGFGGGMLAVIFQSNDFDRLAPLLQHPPSFTQIISVCLFGFLSSVTGYLSKLCMDYLGKRLFRKKQYIRAVTENCLHCGNKIQGKRKDAQYCSHSCSRKAYLARKNLVS